MKKLTGIAASPGIAYGKAFLYVEDSFAGITRYSIREDQIEGELRRLEEASARAAAEMRELYERARSEMGQEQAAIVSAHLMMLEDEEYLEQIRNRLRANLENIEWVIRDHSLEMARLLSGAADPYLRERSADITDVSRRLIQALLPVKRLALSDLEEDVILVAHDLLPSELLSAPQGRIKGIVMDAGSRTSHTAILAQSFGIPAVLGLSSVTKEIAPGDTVAVDGIAGEVALNPAERTLSRYRAASSRYQKNLEGLLSSRELPAETKDGYRVRLEANIEAPEEAAQALRFGAEGIGLYRSEFLFLRPGESAEEETQYRAYSQVIEMMAGRPVTIRTIDLGGDKVNPLLRDSGEKNPLLGWRAIRFCFSHPELFKTQLRAILRASANGKVNIMFPMISGVEDLEKALALLEEAKGECRKRRQSFDERIEAGTMIEVPSAALTADILAKKSAFFSIGTNDLIQYTVAADRGNERVNYLAQPSHPAVLRLLKMIIQAAHARGIRAAMCGELAGDIKAAPLLLGLGLDEFSMNAALIPQIKGVIRETTLSACKDLAERALACETGREATALVNAWFAANPSGAV
ncbi:MAG: phosphoenolpyruvate--protein phosphotransferase [Spirochaetaceae bacterium]|jgi:phosphotransferase system enzyme I (PtsI)|nr:phosphoenolpyruvate--protein phosphotransferase [Spirochaetaceae bacterium]